MEAAEPELHLIVGVVHRPDSLERWRSSEPSRNRVVEDSRDARLREVLAGTHSAFLCRPEHLSDAIVELHHAGRNAVALLHERNEIPVLRIRPRLFVDARLIRILNCPLTEEFRVCRRWLNVDAAATQRLAGLLE